MSIHYKNKDCVSLIIKELEGNKGFLDYSDIDMENYLSKIDKYSNFEKYHVDNELAGFASYYCNNVEAKEAFITLMLVDNKYRGMSIGEELVFNVIKAVKDKGFSKCSLEVKIENLNAVSLYKKIGFYESHRNNESIFMSTLV